MLRIFVAAVSFACLAAAPLPAQAPPGWHTLFDGKSLDGWTAKESPGSFRIENEELVIKGPRGHLYYSGGVESASFRNFIFEIELKTEPQANSGVFFHTAIQEEGWPAKGYESQVNATQSDPIKTGSIYGVQNLADPGHKDGEWFTKTIAVKRDLVEIRVDGRLVNSYREPKAVSGERRLSRGTFALQAHDPDSVVHVRKIRVRPLPDHDAPLSRAERRLLQPGDGWWQEMDYGPFVSSTVEVDASKERVLKGITFELDPEQRYQATFDTDLLRYGALFEGPLELRGVTYDGSHGGNPRIRGKKLFTNATAAGVTDSAESFGDPRPIPHGPLPADMARYTGLHRQGDRVTFEYEAYGRRVLDGLRHAVREEPAPGERISASDAKIDRPSLLTRELLIAPGDTAITLRLADLPPGEPAFQGGVNGMMAALISGRGQAGKFLEGDGSVLIGTDKSSSLEQLLASGGPKRGDAADPERGPVRFRWVEAKGRPHASAGAEGDQLPRLQDGADARNDDDVERATWFDGRAFRLIADLGRATELTRIDTYSWHRENRAPQVYSVWGHSDRAASAEGEDLAAAGFVRLAEVDTRGLGMGGRHAAVIAAREGTLGTFGQLVFVLVPVSRREGPFLTEIDLWTPEIPAPKLRARAFREQASAAMGFVVRAQEGVDLFRMGGEGGEGASLALRVPASKEPVRIQVLMDAGLDQTPGPADVGAMLQALADRSAAARKLPLEDLEASIQPGPRLWPEVVTAIARPTREGPRDRQVPFVVDDIPVPFENPYGSYFRIGGFDFFADGRRAAVCTWNGDVWIVDGLGGASISEVRWSRFASGLYETLGLKIVDDLIYVNGKDQITRLHDRNGDGEADFYENFCNLVLTTENFHEFTFDLQTDREGRFYVSKAAPVRGGGRGFDKIVPHHGTVLRIAKDGRSIEVYASGLRAPNGLGVSPDGQVTTGDNEGTWVPHCKLHWLKEGSFQGVIDTAHADAPPETYNPPLLWFPMEVDNSSGAQVWVTGDGWADLKGEMLHFSYGQSAIYRVLRDETSDPVQGAVVKLPIRLGSSAMRGRFHPKDGQLYVSGLRGWQTNAARLSAFQRVRRTDAPLNLPSGFDATPEGIVLRFAEPLDPRTATDPKSYALSWWNYVWGPQYGSPELSADAPDEEIARRAQNQELHEVKRRDRVEILSVVLADDARSVRIVAKGLKPVMQFELDIDVEDQNGVSIRTKVIGTIHALEAKGPPR